MAKKMPAHFEFYGLSTAKTYALRKRRGHMQLSAKIHNNLQSYATSCNFEQSCKKLHEVVHCCMEKAGKMCGGGHFTRRLLASGATQPAQAGRKRLTPQTREPHQ
jgi:hypothetical protein